MARHGRDVVDAVLVFSLDAAQRVLHQDLDALVAAEGFLVALLDAEVAGVVAAAVVTVLEHVV